MHLLPLLSQSPRRLTQAFILTLLTALSVQGQTNFYENFEAGNMNNWAVVGAATALSITATNNKVPVSGGTYSAKTISSGDRMYATSGLGSISYGSFKLSYWLYDSS